LESIFLIGRLTILKKNIKEGLNQNLNKKIMKNKKIRRV
jgi:hypothetical protein